MNDVRLLGVLVTYRRPAPLTKMLELLGEQTHPLTRLVVIDNSPSPETKGIVEAGAKGLVRPEYLPSPEPLGPAGGRAVGMERLLEDAEPHDWIVCLDDDAPPMWSTLFADLLAFGREMRQEDDRTGGVGIVGARFDWRRGRLLRPRDDELTGAVAIDYIGGNNFPLYSVDAVQEMGTFSAPLFFGCEEVEYGLRLRRGGYSLFACGPLWLELRHMTGRADTVVKPELGLAEPTWRRYYSMRNTIHILRKFEQPWTAARVAILQGVLKPLANVVHSPRNAWRHLKLNVAACRHGWTGRLGRLSDPTESYPGP